jgi:starch phosphorylase
MEKSQNDIPNHFNLPRRLTHLAQLTYNLWWVWNPDAQTVFSFINKDLWERVHHNPVVFLRKVERSRLNAVTKDRYYLDFFDRVFRNFDNYMKEENTWFFRTYPDLVGSKIAYFSFEFGLHEALPIYAGGLGILSADHIKEASDLGMPMVGVGFLYTEGYFSQHITEDGWQEARPSRLVFDDLPVIPLFGDSGKPLSISIELPGRVVKARIWLVQVGRNPLYLLDTNIDENSPGDRQLTARLYTGDLELRISQEILLGMGGVRALRLLGHQPAAWHMNEGHSAFLTLERIREYVKQGLTKEEAIKKVSESSIFTTHTPVPAGNDEFPLWMVDKYFSNLWPELGMTREQLIDLARQTQSWGGETFSMSVLALRLANQRNAVSELHGQVSHKMWAFIWPDLKVEEVPITHITNGVHTGTWLGRRMRMLYERYLGSDFLENIDDPDMWNQIENIPDSELWVVRRHLKRKLVSYASERARAQWLSGTVHPIQTIAAGVLLDPYALTIGFARRFATYKRASLILRNPDRLLKLLNQPNMPIQIIFAGKSHPADEPGKLLIQEVYRHVKNAKNGGRLVFLEDYDMNLARFLVQGVDVWLNTPRRPMEASGTSGQKAALNGVLNFSVMDGWWREGYNGYNGWAIGDDTEYSDPNQQDEADAESLYDTLENEIVPLYYTNRSADGLPGEWLARVKESIRTVVPQFSMRRMVKEYMQLYLNAIAPKKVAVKENHPVKGRPKEGEPQVDAVTK